MSISTKIKNNLKYLHYMNLRKKAYANAMSHMNDTDPKEFVKYTRRFVRYMRKCIDIPLN